MLSQLVPSLPTLLAYLVASVVLGLTPGPDMTFFLSKTISQSRTAGFAALAGASTGLLVHSVLVAAGLSVLLAASVVAFTVLKVVGAAYLAYLAYDALCNGSSLNLDRLGIKREPLTAIYAKGLLVNLLNPKVIIFFVTFLPQFVASNDAHVPGKLLFLGLTFIVANIPVCGALIFAGGHIARWLKGSKRVTRFVDYLFAGVLGAFAVRLILAHGR